jgi:hypothetical protein
MQFDARAAKQLTAGQHFTITDCPGLRLEASATRRSWIYRYKSPVDGRMRQTKIGEWPAVSLAAATVEWERLRSARGAGADLASDKRSARAAVQAAAAEEMARVRSATLTVRKVCNIYMAGHVERNRKPKSIAEARRTFDTMLGEFGDLPAATLTRAQAFALIEGHVHIPVQAARLRAELGAAWDYALDAGRLPESAPNWWRLIMRGRLRSKGRMLQGKPAGVTKRVLDATELGALIRWLPNFPRLTEEACTMYLWTCTRGAEFLAMEVGEIADEVDGLWWTVPKVKTKNAWREDATDLRVPLVCRAEAIVRRRLQVAKAAGKSFLWPSTGEAGYVQQKTIGACVWIHMPYSGTRPGYVRPRLTVTTWAPHDLRRSSRTQLAVMGCADEVAEAVIGHMQPGVKGVYNRHAYDRERREWLTKLSARLEELAAAIV